MELHAKINHRQNRKQTKRIDRLCSNKPICRHILRLWAAVLYVLLMSKHSSMCCLLFVFSLLMFVLLINA